MFPVLIGQHPNVLNKCHKIPWTKLNVCLLSTLKYGAHTPSWMIVLNGVMKLRKQTLARRGSPKEAKNSRFLVLELLGKLDANI